MLGEVRRLKQMEEVKRKQLVADLSLDTLMLRKERFN
jgi:hypothetical protein